MGPCFVFVFFAQEICQASQANIVCPGNMPSIARKQPDPWRSAVTRAMCTGIMLGRAETQRVLAHSPAGGGRSCPTARPASSCRPPRPRPDWCSCCSCPAASPGGRQRRQSSIMRMLACRAHESQVPSSSPTCCSAEVCCSRHRRRCGQPGRWASLKCCTMSHGVHPPGTAAG